MRHYPLIVHTPLGEVTLRATDTGPECQFSGALGPRSQAAITSYLHAEGFVQFFTGDIHKDVSPAEWSAVHRFLEEVSFDL